MLHCCMLIIFQAKQLQIDDLLTKLDHANGDVERLREEKDQEIAILQEGMDATIQQLSEAQQVSPKPRRCTQLFKPHLCRTKG